MTTPSPRLLRRLLWALWLLGLVTLVLAVLWLRGRAAGPSAAELPVIREVPPFSLTNRDGTEADLERLAGRPWIADFVFTTCPGICPIMTRRMAELQADLAPALDADRLHLVSFSVDPETDTPEVLEAYAREHGAHDDWLFLTGPEDVLYPLIRDGFLLVLDPTPRQRGEEPIVHSNRFVLVDAENRIRGYYNAFDEAELARLRADVARLLG